MSQRRLDCGATLKRVLPCFLTAFAVASVTTLGLTIIAHVSRPPCPFGCELALTACPALGSGFAVSVKEYASNLTTCYDELKSGEGYAAKFIKEIAGYPLASKFKTTVKTCTMCMPTGRMAALLGASPPPSVKVSLHINESYTPELSLKQCRDAGLVQLLDKSETRSLYCHPRIDGISCHWGTFSGGDACSNDLRYLFSPIMTDNSIDFLSAFNNDDFSGTLLFQTPNPVYTSTDTNGFIPMVDFSPAP